MAAADKEVFVPDEGADDEADETGEGTGVDTLLGNAFDAFQDGDREGFIRSLRAALNSKE
jgi:hypothetical protein